MVWGLVVLSLAGRAVGQQLGEPLQPPPVSSGSAMVSPDLAKDLSDVSMPLVPVSALLAEMSGGPEAHGLALRAADAALSATFAAEVLKFVTREPRPPRATNGVFSVKGGGVDSFPSGHTATAFAYARVLADQYPHQKDLWYGLAAGVGWSRMGVRAHFVQDVVAGAALGYWIGGASLRTEDGLLGMHNWGLSKPRKVGGGVLTLGPMFEPDEVLLFRYEW